MTAVPYPLDINNASMTELEALPGIGKQRAGDLVVNRPYETPEAVGGEIDLSAFVTTGSGASQPSD